jgi:hypothetical protein
MKAIVPSLGHDNTRQAFGLHKVDYFFEDKEKQLHVSKMCEVQMVVEWSTLLT